MAYRANLSIAPTTLTDLKITVIDNTVFSKIYTLDDCTISNYIECEITYTDSSTTANIYSPGYQVENIVLTDYDGSVINLTPISDYSKTSDGINTYYVKDNYERSLANDIYNITQAQLALKEDINNKVTSLSSSSTNIQYPSAKCVYDELALKEDSLGYTPADISLSNLDSNGIKAISAMASLSVSNQIITKPASGGTITAPVEGYIWFAHRVASTGQFICLTKDS